MTKKSQDKKCPEIHCREPLKQELSTIFHECIECNKCLRNCLFLKKFGNPKKIVDAYNPENETSITMPFACSLCSLCHAVCPVQINPRAMFLEMRRESVSRGKGFFQVHNVLINYEKRGTSRYLTYYALPEKCDTVFFPGCALSGTRPKRVVDVFNQLRKKIPNIGIVFDCCTKPSHDLGRTEYFSRMFKEMCDYLKTKGINTLLVACPSCYSTFAEYAPGFEVRTVYEALAGDETGRLALSGTVSIHDSCAVRFEQQIHDAVRKLVHGLGLGVREAKHHGKKTFCCGEGGAVGFFNKKFARNWGLLRQAEQRGEPVVTYCAGCAHYLSKVVSTVHILDLLFEPKRALSGKCRVSRAPLTYFNRLLLKLKFKRILAPSVSRERRIRQTDVFRCRFFE